MLYLYLQAPFAAFRTFSAGWYRSTAGFLTPSAAYGLALNLAGIESRRDDGLSPMTVTRFGLPPARLALGAADGELPTVQTIFQQLHSYTVGKGSKVDDPDNPGKQAYQGVLAQRRVKGNKFNITPVRREFLADLRAHLAIEFPANPEVEARIVDGLDGRVPRYGLPFLGDNAFLLDKVEVRPAPGPARWYRRLGDDDRAGAAPGSTRLTIWVDRKDMSKTRSALFAPDDMPGDEIPPSAWTPIDPPDSPAGAPGPKTKG